MFHVKHFSPVFFLSGGCRELTLKTKINRRPVSRQPPPCEPPPTAALSCISQPPPCPVVIIRTMFQVKH